MRNNRTETKVTVAATVAAAVTVVVFLVHQLAGVDIPPEVAAAIATVLAAAGAWLAPHTDRSL